MVINKLLFVFVFLLFGNEVISQCRSCEKANTKSEERSSLKSQNVKKMSHIDLLMNNLKHEHWEPDERICYDKIINIMTNVKNSTLWAMWIWDCMQSPTGLFFGSRYNFGHYDQCLKAPWLKTHPAYRTQYCLADFKFYKEELKEISVGPEESVEAYTKSVSKHGVTFNEVTLGVCLPSECQTKSIEKFVKVLFEDSHLGNLPEVDISVDHCQLADTSVEYALEYYIVMTIFLGAIATIIVCNMFTDETSSSSVSIGAKIANALHLYTNMSYLTKTSEDEIRTIHGIRALTSALVVTLHIWFVTLWITPGNSLQMDLDIENYGLSMFYHSELLVDTFIMMSGLLLINGIANMKNFNPFILIVKRYLRLLWITSLFLLFASSVLAYVGSGPLFTKLAKIEKTACDKNWWANLLMMGNYIDTTNMCYPVLWTIPCDFHLTISAVLLYWIFTKNKRLGALLFSIIFALAIIVTGVYTYQNNLPPAPLFNMKNIRDYRKVLFANPTYMKTHFRAGAYYVGAVAGYIMSVYKPKNYRKTIPKLWSTILFYTALYVAIKVMSIGSEFHDSQSSYDAIDTAVFASLNRSVWAAAIATIIMICEYGTVPLMNTFFTWTAFIPVSKLSYGVYLIHTIVFSFVITTIRTPFTFGVYTVFLWSFGVLVMSNIFSLLLHLFLEAPMTKTLNIFIANKRTTSTQNGKHIKTQNGFRKEETTNDKKIS